MNIKLVVFDMAGTVVDEDNVVYKTLMKAINNNGYNYSLDRVLEVGAGKEKLQAVEDILSLDEKAHNNDEATKIHSEFLIELDNAYNNLDVKPQPNANNIFNWLKENNIKVVLNTGYNRAIAEMLCRKLNWDEGKEIDFLITASDVKTSRPAPDMINLASKKFNIPTIQTAKVGDSIIDIEEGKNAGCGLSIGITTGAHTNEQLQTAQPSTIINNLLELKEILAN